MRQAPSPMAPPTAAQSTPKIVFVGNLIGNRNESPISDVKNRRGNSDRQTGVPPMDSKQILDKVVAQLRGIGYTLSGDDSDLADIWEEIKEQVQNGPSFFWSAYAQTIEIYTYGVIDSLTPEELEQTMAAFKRSSRESLQREIIRRLMLRAKREKIRFKPFDFEYFWYYLLDFTAYGRVVKRVGLDKCEAVVYSVAAPGGERGVIDISRIENTMSEEEFKRARALKWPEKWTEGEESDSVEDP